MVCRYMFVHSLLAVGGGVGFPVSFLIFCLVVLSIAQSAVSKPPTIILDLWIRLFLLSYLSDFLPYTARHC